MKTLLRSITVLLLCVLSVPVMATQEVRNVRAWLAPDNTRLVFDMSGPVEHKLFTLSGPDRVVIDIEGARLKASFDGLGLDKSPVGDIRYSHRDDGLRVVLDLKEKVRPKSFDLKPNDQYGHRLVVDLAMQSKATVTKTVVPIPGEEGKRDIVVMIDAGHGGEDPGAIGPGGVREKDVVLAIARKLKDLIDARKGYRAVMTRTGDYYISLRGRTGKARKSNADLFVSIHADAFKDARARGASVWVLSGRGATSEMGRWLARRENSADLIGGVGSLSLDDKDDVLASVLLDMSMNASRKDSHQVASRIHGNIDRFARMHKKHVEQAGFVVLKSPDIPSILVETGFISNPGEARKLKTASYQRQMAEAIYRGITDHFWNKPPAATYIAWQKQNGKPDQSDRLYKVVSGDTLSVIAQRNGVSLQQLRRANKLNSDRIRVGQVLRIPAG
ncbi:N-acetylmuramoyl-L-alanine amidase [Marinobacterium sp. AK62]|uniref:N-acetylmuramoyl-L-alanine amidase n=1 Tax=Marinobacterium alkalitolerans TaxID=1542925 RepID=A0ABS3Z906_9GAMM|nr:N-acetylmuramoyl-L-alanine amidase [Marinobacterium alkalitolerans]MBP0047790.1 N-acetylmuramoyl-L-alanine amidase [Marinobacterium alkalitolerans]